MSKPVKDMITRELASRYEDTSNAVWVEIVGVDGITTNEFRRDLRSREMRLEVVKSALLHRACANGPLAPLAKALCGPAALLTGGQTAIDIAKVLEQWRSSSRTKCGSAGRCWKASTWTRSGSKACACRAERDLQGRIVQIMLARVDAWRATLLVRRRQPCGLPEGVDREAGEGYAQRVERTERTKRNERYGRGEQLKSDE